MDVYDVVWKEEALKFTVSYHGVTEGTVQVWEQVLRAENAKAASFPEMYT